MSSEKLAKIPYTLGCFLWLSRLLVLFSLFESIEMRQKETLDIVKYPLGSTHISRFVCILQSSIATENEVYEFTSHPFGIDARRCDADTVFVHPYPAPFSFSAHYKLPRGVFLLHGTEDGGGQSLRAFYLPLPETNTRPTAVLAASGLR
jgi:hypothetical protein